MDLRGDAGSGCLVDGRYRYLLWRRWAAADRALFVMLNPSTADHVDDDPTIRRCVGFARAWGLGGVAIANLFAWRATDPRDLRRARRPVGRRTDEILRAEATRAAVVIAAWGIHGALHGRDREVTALLDGTPLRCLGVTAAGAPRHPLYLRGDARATPWPRRSGCDIRPG